ncbi:hypothetical protein P8625_01545 [Tenacibaculum tangerinum]|uniref:Uncharacterized protein n=1 Tax=Tenacibaculum tangerinum TaxID=3038772 RepID=A0ABY8L3N5_9FLAO|nr:hypothetical protein [Tenacibaculum tangerinum]WGH75874.1 hypothetical protein P8625_01545 [Tenacibaculum tangerinum]
MRTLKFTLLITLLFLLTTSCTDLTEDIIPTNTTQNTELVSGIGDTTTDDGTPTPDTGDGDGTGSDGTKGN